MCSSGTAGCCWNWVATPRRSCGPASRSASSSPLPSSAPPVRCFQWETGRIRRIDLVVSTAKETVGFRLTGDLFLHNRDVASLRLGIERGVIDRGYLVYCGSHACMTARVVIVLPVQDFVDHLDRWMACGSFQEAREVFRAVGAGAPRPLAQSPAPSIIAVPGVRHESSLHRPVHDVRGLHQSRQGPRGACAPRGRTSCTSTSWTATTCPTTPSGPTSAAVSARSSPLPLDIHLMIENVDAHVPLFAKIPNAVVSFHPEVAWHPLRTIELIRSCGARAGIAIDPALPLAAVRGDASAREPRVRDDGQPRLRRAGADPGGAGEAPGRLPSRCANAAWTS